MKSWLLKFHRWIALLFALPLVFVLASGLVLSIEPWLVVRAIAPGSLTSDKILRLLQQNDPGGKARAISYRSYDNTLTIGGGRGGGTTVNATTGEILPGPSGMANGLATMRRLHESLLINAGWLVIASTAAMLALATLGVLMGLPRFTNTLPGWHMAMSWGLLPLVVLSPLTGLFLAYNITFTAPPPATASQSRAPASLSEAVRIVGEGHDLAALVWMRPLGNRLVVRVVEDGEYRLYSVTQEGTVLMSRNWPRLWHEGNFASYWSAGMNVVTSIAMIGLLLTGPWIWLRRRLRMRARRIQQASAPR